MKRSVLMFRSSKSSGNVCFIWFVCVITLSGVWGIDAGTVTPAEFLSNTVYLRDSRFIERKNNHSSFPSGSRWHLKESKIKPVAISQFWLTSYLQIFSVFCCIFHCLFFAFFYGTEFYLFMKYIFVPLDGKQSSHYYLGLFFSFFAPRLS